jgi:hypothetical protein
LNTRIGGNETSELNGEILNACDDPAHRTILSLAMRRDDEAVIRMRDWVGRQYSGWAADVGRKSLQSLSLRPKDRGEKIREIFAE